MPKGSLPVSMPSSIRVFIIVLLASFSSLALGDLISQYKEKASVFLLGDSTTYIMVSDDELHACQAYTHVR